jgi:hypothetical protein
VLLFRKRSAGNEGVAVIVKLSTELPRGIEGELGLPDSHILTAVCDAIFTWCKLAIGKRRNVQTAH